jgi:hypothetical protein
VSEGAGRRPAAARIARGGSVGIVGMLGAFWLWVFHRLLEMATRAGAFDYMVVVRKTR